MTLQTSNFKLPTFLSALCLLASVLCPPVRAGGSWLVDGAAVQTLEVHLPDYDTRYVEKVDVQTIVVDVGSDAQANGTALLAAYAQAKTMSPSIDNELVVILPPASYDLGASTLVMDTEYINLIGKIPVTLTTSGAVVVPWDSYDEILDTEVVLTNVSVSAVVSGDAPKSIVTSSGVAVSCPISHATVAYLKIKGRVSTSGSHSALWHDVWFSDPVDRGTDSSNAFIRVYAPSGICSAYQGVDTSFLGRLEDSVVLGAYTLGGSGGSVDATLVGNTIVGTGCCAGGSGGSVKGLFVGNTISGESCLGGDGGSVDADFIRNTIIGTACLGGMGGTIDGHFQGNTILGSFCLGGDSGTINADFVGDTIRGMECIASYGTVNASFDRCTLEGPWHMGDVTYTANTSFRYTAGIVPAVTNSSAKLLFCTDDANNPLPNQ